ncbi:4Fe-4S binding protein [Clostridium sp. DSM 100503]|uniref:4Fe-4S binding protein n=1 Tax=Clostridium sp. DSM 100503 TaxID=2963282 RepID=UPI00214A517A|nr:4Fe-4S binding protein [Clostridium sp. DSM 100503]MCR1951258.1 4Fe-4S binding protein [Clostridium sp. DSM 100503]
MSSLFKIWKKWSYVILIAFLVLGIFDFRIGLIASICMVAPIIISVFKGRFWCGNLCPRGNFYDNVVSKFSNKKKVPKFIKSLYFRLVAIALMLTVFTTGMINNWGNLYGMGFVIYRLIVITTIIGLVLAPFYNERIWCNFCPMGSIAAFISKFRNKQNKNLLLSINDACVSCKLCTKTCPMGINVHEYKNESITYYDCIQCGKCVNKCPKKSIGYTK